MRLNRHTRRVRGALAGVVAALTLSAPALPAAAAPPDRCLSVCAPTSSLKVGEVTYAYRAVGPAGARPLVLLNRFRGSMDEWDPAFLDALARTRRVIIFDNVGVARTDGLASPRLAGWSDNAAAFIRALGLKEVDLLGYSFGGLVAQQLTLDHPELVRRLVIVGSGAGYVEGANLRAEALQVATKPVNTDEDFLFLFFRNTPTSQAAGRAHLARLRQRPGAFDVRVSEATWRAMLSAGSDVGTPETSLLRRAPQIRKPVLVANGVEDNMIPTIQSYALAQALPQARLILYPDAGHAFMFQYPQLVGRDVAAFLDEPPPPAG
ncbi:alpha/beta fold hydrolase [Phenylobacterium deserti]|uniref:Alpha/beta hydrolase n=1 Tax=Phenylobacterium deserti TaxID=1914756 RepID=A0A328ADH0_9CAUL|nr:alpha/beta hydrolase [Phenylobacterium deserti]RAK52709.1 alpha/beta hydrolase [Phenylobacterium deserti]